MSKRYEKLEKEDKELEDKFLQEQKELEAKEKELEAKEPEAKETEPEKEVQEEVSEEKATEAVPEKEVTPEKGKQEELLLKIEKDDPNSETWKSKYATIEGKYKIEVPRLNQDVKQWKEHAVALNAKIADLEKALETFKHTTTTVETNKDIDSLISEYPDIGKVLKKINDDHRLEIQSLEQKITKGMEQELNTVKSDISVSRRERFDMLMRAQGVPDWQEVDVDPRFMEFLNEPAGPYTRKTKLQFLQEAAGDLDAETVSKFFLDFKALSKEKEAPPDNRQEKLEKFIAPPKGQATKTPGGGQKQILTREAYERFWKESSKGRFNPADWNGLSAQQVENMLDQAVINGELR